MLLVMVTMTGILTPLNSLQVNSFLNHLPQRRHFTEPGHMLDEEGHSIVDLGLGGEAAQAEPDGGVRQLLVGADGAEDVGGLEGGGGAGRAGGHRHVLHGHQQRLPLHVAEGEVEVARVPSHRVPVEHHLGDLAQDAVLQPAAEVVHPGRVVSHLLAGHAAGCAEADAEGVRERARAQAPLLAAAVHERLQAHARPPPHVERADALGPVNLVAGKGHEVDLQIINIDGHLAKHLRCISVKESLVCSAHLPNLLQGLQHADLVVDGHHGDHARVRPQGRRQLLQPDQPVLLHGQVGDLEPLLLELAAAVQHALVLGLRGDHVPLALAEEPHRALDGEVVALGGARGEHDLLRVGAHQRRHLRPGGLHRRLRLPAVGVRLRVRVAVPLQHVGQHGVEHAGVHGRRGLHVQVQRPPRLRLPLD
mmetsp:Transcript_20823/g.28690  ORF Transcript_20823/g.28690 Transcript_20823/m.28690 type:complete len:420 (-) Transcript_20823:258-1517(-)